MTLEMKPACQTCQAALQPGGGAHICSHECTFCADCAQTRRSGRCPNCGGELVRRPKRKS